MAYAISGRGKRSEDAAMQALNLPSRPKWIQSVRLATPEEDQKGIDIVVGVDVGELHLQVKSSNGEAKKFRRNARRNPNYSNRKNIAVLVVKSRKDLDYLLNKAAWELSKIRDDILLQKDYNGEISPTLFMKLLILLEYKLMPKFDIFNESSWHPLFSQKDEETMLRNKALGAIGNKIHEINNLKDSLIKASSLDKAEDFLIADELRRMNPEAFKIMGVHIEYPESQITEVIMAVDQILSTWKDVANRKERWRSLIDPLKKIKPYLNDNTYFDTSHQEFKELTTVKITGNPAWEIYLSQVKRIELGKLLLSRTEEEKNKYKSMLIERNLLDDYDYSEDD